MPTAPVAAVLAALTLSGCAVAAQQPAAPGVAARARLGAFVTVAKRVYHEESAGRPAVAAVRRIARDRRLLRALARGNRAAIQVAAKYQLYLPAKHVVRLRVVRGGRSTFDVGGAFVVAGQGRTLPGGRGRLQLSIQDVIGYVKLVHGQTGAAVVVRGTAGHVVGSSPAAAHARLPASGLVTLAGRRYLARSFAERGFGGEPLTVWVLDRV